MPSKPVIYLYEHGINSVPSSWRDWVNRAIAYTHLKTDFRAQSLFYFTTALTVFVRERSRSRAFADLLLKYAKAGWEIHLVGHSNGTRVLLEGLRLANWPAIKNVHLVCGACDCNFERLGLNNALYTGKIEKAFVYRGAKDWAMKIENTMPGKFIFNIPDRPLGLSGPTNVRQSLKEVVVETVWPDYGHSDCWLPANFEKTMQCFLPSAC